MPSTIVGDNFDSIYGQLMQALIDEPEYVCCPRRQKINERLVVTLVLNDPRKRILNNPAREANYGFAVGEFLWYLRGASDLQSMLYYNKRMKDFSDDGETLNSAYGRRIFGWDDDHNISQWEAVKKTLREDHDSRRAVIDINMPKDELMAADVGSKDVPCTMHLQFFIRNDKLHMHTTMRSNDVVWGLTYDLFSFTMLQELMLNELRFCDSFNGIELGQYYHTAGSMHLYDRHFDVAKNIVMEWQRNPRENGAMKPFTKSNLNILSNDEERLRCLDIMEIDAKKFGEHDGCYWLAQQLNAHRQKRNKENGAA